MNDAGFWSIVGTPTGRQREEGDEDAVLAAIQLRLARAAESAPESVLIGFETHVAEKLRALDTPASYSAGGDEPSADAFLYRRCFVVSCGRDIFETALTNPSSVSMDDDHWLEGLLYLASELAEELTGAPLDLDLPTYESFQSPAWK